MKTKEEILTYIQDELSSNNMVVCATTGNGGAGLTYLKLTEYDDLNEVIEMFASYEFMGKLKTSDICCDIIECKFYNPTTCSAYGFYMSSKYENNPTIIQVMIEDV